MATYTSHLNLKLPDYSDVADVKDLNDNFKKIDDAIASGGTGGGTGGITQETDPTVPSWAKQPNKPTYTAAEVGALPNTTVIPTVPTTLPNPQPIVINGQSYDGSKAVTMTIQAEGGGAAIDTTLTQGGQAADAAAVGEALGKKITDENGAVTREHIADLAINNAKLDYNSVSNAKIRAGAIEMDRLSANALAYLTGGPYVSVSYDGSARADITQGRHVFALRLIDDSTRNLKTWLINHSTYDGVYLHQGTDIEGPLKLLGRSDFIGGIHGDEQLVSVRMIADGVDITGTATDLAGVKTLAVYVTSTVYDVDSDTALFSREKVLTFSGMSLTVENRWTYTGEESVSVERWPGCGLYSTYVENTLGYTTNHHLIPSMDALEADADIKEVSFWVSGTKVTLQALRGMDGKTYAGFMENVSGASRIKAYFDTIHAPNGYALETGDVLEAAYRITIGEEAAGKINEIPEIPDSLPNPFPLTINGQSYDGSKEKTIDISSGVYPVVAMTASSAELAPNTFYKWGEIATLTITLGIETSGVTNEYCFEFVSGDTATTLTVPDTICWAQEPTVEAGKTYQVSILNQVGVIIGA